MSNLNHFLKTFLCLFDSFNSFSSLFSLTFSSILTRWLADQPAFFWLHISRSPVTFLISKTAHNIRMKLSGYSVSLTLSLSLFILSAVDMSCIRTHTGGDYVDRYFITFSTLIYYLSSVVNTIAKKVKVMCFLCVCLCVCEKARPQKRWYMTRTSMVHLICF